MKLESTKKKKQWGEPNNISIHSTWKSNSGVVYQHHHPTMEIGLT